MDGVSVLLGCVMVLAVLGASSGRHPVVFGAVFWVGLLGLAVWRDVKRR